MDRSHNANVHAVLAAVQAHTSHPTALEIYETVRLVRPRIGLATVYRILHHLTRQGAIGVWEPGSACARYDRYITRHDHAFCTVCGTLLDVPGEIELPRAVLEQAARAVGIEPGSHEVRIYGRCERCRTRSKT